MSHYLLHLLIFKLSHFQIFKLLHLLIFKLLHLLIFKLSHFQIFKLPLNASIVTLVSELIPSRLNTL